MLADISPQKFNEWIAMYKLEPWGDDWAQAGTVAAAVCNASGNYKETKSPSEFVPGAEDRVVAMTEEEMQEKYRRQYGGK